MNTVFAVATRRLKTPRRCRRIPRTSTSTLAGVEAAVLAFGHLHIPNIRSVGSMTLVNVSSVNMPGDGDGRAKYAMLEWNGETWTATHHRVEYDATAEREAFIARRPPGWEGAVASLDEQGYYYPQRI